jgi:hypothetical protein
MPDRQQHETEHVVSGAGSAAPEDPEWEHLQSAVDEAEVQSFPASDPQSSWAGSDRGSIPWWDEEQQRRAP